MAKLPNITDLKECPYCKGDEFVIYSKPIGKMSDRYRYDGAEADNSGMMESLSAIPEKFVYCSDCFKKIARNNKDY